MDDELSNMTSQSRTTLQLCIEVKVFQSLSKDINPTFTEPLG